MALIYVGTYAKYNAGSLFGKHLDPEDYVGKDEFLYACRELHKDEEDPELMFQDWEEIPSGMISESHVSGELWDWLDLDEDDRELLKVYQEDVNSSGDIEEARDSFAGKYNSKADWAESFVDDCDLLEDMPAQLRGYFDFKAYARDAEVGGSMSFVQHEGYVWAFRNN